MGLSYFLYYLPLGRGAVLPVLRRTATHQQAHGASLQAAPGEAGRLANSPKPVADRTQRPPQLPSQKDVLDQLNVLYEELLTSQEWAGASQPPRRQPLSVLEITRYLAGWPPPRAEALRASRQ